MTNKNFKIALNLLFTSTKYTIKCRNTPNGTTFFLDCPGPDTVDCVFCSFNCNQGCTISRYKDTFTPDQLDILKPLYPEYFL